MSQLLGSLSDMTDKPLSVFQDTEREVLRARITQLEEALAEQTWITDVMKAMTFDTASTKGPAFLQALLQQMATRLKVRHIFVTEWVPESTDRLRTVSGWSDNQPVEVTEYDVSGTPCQQVVQTGEGFFPRDVRRLFPHDPYLITHEIESYMGVPLFDSAGCMTGHLCLMDTQPFSFTGNQGSTVLRLFSARVGAELERLRVEEALRQREERFRALYDDNPSMYFTLSPEGTVISVNRYGAKQLGYTADDLVGQSVLTVFDRADHHTVLTQLTQCAADPQRTFEWEIQKIRKDGTHLWVNERARAIIDAQGTVSILVVCEDVTERHRTTSLLSTLVRASPLAMISLDPDGRVMSWNQAATRLFGWTESEVMGHELPYVQPGEESAADALWQAGIRGEIISPIELRRRRKDGAMLDLLLWPVFVHDAPGKLSTAIGIYVDQSELKRAEQALVKSEARLNFLVSHSPAMIYTASVSGDLDATFISANIKDRLGYEPHEFTCTPGFWADRIHPDDAPELFRNIPRLFQQNCLSQEYRFRNAQGEYRWMHDELVLIRDHQQQPVEILGSWFDITERKQMEEALRASEAHLLRFLADAPVGLVILGEDQHVIFANKALCELTGYAKHDIVGNTYKLYTHPDDLPANLILTDEFYRGARSEYTCEKRYIRKSGEIIWVSVKATRIELPGHCGPLLLAAVHDITERKLATEERERLSRDLHDNILQSLYAVGMQLEAGKLAMGKSPRRGKTHMTYAIDQLSRLMSDVRRFIALLTQRTTTKSDFGQSLRKLVRSVSAASQAEQELQIDDAALSMLSTAQEEQLLNIAREALSNSIRHARASRRVIRLSRTARGIRLVISDDGIGFLPRHHRCHGHGLANMAARAQQIQARLILKSVPGEGARVTVEIPVEQGTAHV